MDPLTHGLLGATTGYALFGRKIGRHAALIGGMAALVPDADAFLRSQTDPLFAIEYHRHFTHSWMFAIFASWLFALPWLLQKQWHSRRWYIYGAACLPMLTHGVLDSSTTYGTLWHWPWSHTRISWNLISIIDPIFTLLLLVGLIVACHKRRLRFARIALVLCLGYLSFGRIQNYRAQETQLELAASRGHSIEKSVVMPTLGNNVVWRSLYLYDGRLFSDRIRVSWIGKTTFKRGTWKMQVVQNDLDDRERLSNGEHQYFERFAWFTNGWIARAPHDELILADMRYSLSDQAFDPIWGIRFTDPNDIPTVEWVNRTRERQLSLKSLWLEIAGAHPGHIELSIQ